MPPLQLHLNKGCAARLPQLNFQAGLTADEAQENWTKALLVHILASARLEQDIGVFIEWGPYSQSQNQVDSFVQFLVSIRHHTDVLLEPTLVQLREGLHQYRSMLGKERYITGRIPSIGDLLDLAASGLKSLQITLANAWIELHLKLEDYATPLGAMVPTAAPREILISLLLNHPRMLQRMTSVGANTFLANIGTFLNLPSAPNIDSREFEIKNVNADGAPKMFFACHHINENGNHEFYVGANQADWEGLESIADIRRADRDCRLARYIPLAERAYNALHEAEMKVQLPNSMAYMDDKERLYQIRLRAVAAMKNPPNLDFLGRKSETGQAFDKRLKVQQCCYVCHGMMGYHIPKRFKDREVRSYLCHHNWAMRAGYAHSCAEIVVSLQCAQNWMSNGKSPKF